MADIQKTLYFYRIIAEPSLFVNGNDMDSKMYEVFKKIFIKGKGTYDIKPKNKKDSIFRFDIIDFNNEYIFGTFGKTDQRSDPLVRVRETQSNKTEPFELPLGKILEHFTFYLIDFKHRILCLLNNKKVGKLPTELKKFAELQQQQLSILPVVVENLKDMLSLWHHFSKLEFCYSEEYQKKCGYKLPSELSNMDENIGKYTCMLSFKKDNQITAQSLADIPTSKFRYCKVSGTERNGNDERENITLDLVEKTFTRSLKIDISDSYEENLRTVKETLLNGIHNMLTNCP